MFLVLLFFFFFFNDTATTEIYTLSLHDALPISNTPEPRPCSGLAMSALPPSAAMVRAVRQMTLAASGKVSRSLRAALNQETGRVFRIIGVQRFAPILNLTLSYLTTVCQGKSGLGEALATNSQAR